MCLPRTVGCPGHQSLLRVQFRPDSLWIHGKEVGSEGSKEGCRALESCSQAPPAPCQPAPCPGRGAGHLGVGVEKFEQGHDEGVHRDTAAAVLLQVVGHGGALLLVQQVPRLLLQQHAGLVPQAAQRHLGAGRPLVKPQLKDRRTEPPCSPGARPGQRPPGPGLGPCCGLGPPGTPAGHVPSTCCTSAASCSCGVFHGVHGTFMCVISSDPRDHSERSHVIRVPVLFSRFQYLPR